ncbi:hypothetical protein [Streptomyces sp. NPDC001480]|uniref:hypothetical protein n=1 Tax=Streptomyces sp. NPDC001480 TaxID=3364577 RepID=UPI00368DB0B6
MRSRDPSPARFCVRRRPGLYITDGGDAGCGKKGYDVGQFGSYQVQLSWNGDGYDVKSEWFNE